MVSTEQVVQGDSCRIDVHLFVTRLERKLLRSHEINRTDSSIIFNFVNGVRSAETEVNQFRIILVNKIVFLN